MKKLMVAALAAAMVGMTFADCEDPEDPVVSNCARVWDVKISLKTTVAKAKSTTTADCYGETTTDTVCYRVKGTQKYQAVISTCDCTCSEALPDSTYAWDVTNKDCSDNAFTTTLIDGIGKDGKVIEAAGTFGNLTWAGFGTMNRSSNLVKTISGYIAGTIDAANCVHCDDSAASIAINLCDDDTQDQSATAAYGTFTVKYNDAASKKLANNSAFIENSYLPAYVREACIGD